MIAVINTIPAREIEERGIAAVDPLLERGPVHVFVGDRPRYVILDEDTYEELAEAREEAERYRIRESLEDVRAGRVREHRSVADLMTAIIGTDDGDA
jgi:PHD/YefM family antitoxin component YafN of YafNO toxin-antitoxin module